MISTQFSHAASSGNAGRPSPSKQLSVTHEEKNELTNGENVIYKNSSSNPYTEEDGEVLMQESKIAQLKLNEQSRPQTNMDKDSNATVNAPSSHV